MVKQRILLVDDHEVVRLGLKSLLERHPQFEVVGEAASAREALEQVETNHPDVVVMDVRMPRMDGLELVRRIGLPADLFGQVLPHDLERYRRRVAVEPARSARARFAANIAFEDEHSNQCIAGPGRQPGKSARLRGA